MIMPFILTIFIVGFVTAGLGIRFDRFFAILLLLFLFQKNIKTVVDIFLWIILFGTLMVIFENQTTLKKVDKKMKIKLFLFIPLLTLITTFFGSLLFKISAEWVLMLILGIIAILYGLRLIFIHFKEDEYLYENHKPHYVKFCGFFGPLISGFFIGLIGTSLKSLKIPFAVKLGKMNIKQVYLGNTISSFFAAAFALIWHHILIGVPSNMIFNDFLLAAGLWTGMHYISEGTNLFFKNKWKKGFQILIGVILILVSFKIFMMI